jgi:DedD protein
VKTRYIEDDDLELDSPQREISLSPSTVLGIFFLLALICAIFFGFGYSMGKRSATPVAAAVSGNDNDAASLKATGEAKPAPGQTEKGEDLTPADAAAAEASPAESSAPEAPAPRLAVAVPTPVATESTPQPRLQHAVAKSSPVTAPAQLTPAVAVKTPPAVHPAAAAAGQPALVQIAAVSHQEDADILVSALKRKGYTVAVRHEPQDKLFHIQLGPYATRKDADGMKQRLIADGYNAIVK